MHPCDHVVRGTEVDRHAHFQPLAPSQVRHRGDQIHGSIVTSEKLGGYPMPMPGGWDAFRAREGYFREIFATCTDGL